ncbi:MAG: SPOR domain-containing protein [Saprospiraceae bacterium]|nr:SPOR domain-containing protein [Saprospiraceae bacterium]
MNGNKEAKNGFAIQVAVLSNKDNLEKKLNELKRLFIKNILINYEKNTEGRLAYRILIGSFPNANEAVSYQKNLKKKNVTGFIVDLTTLK